MTTSLATLQKDFDEIKPLVKEILQRLRENDTRDIIEAASAKIISEMRKCSCNQEILEALDKTKEKETQIIPFQGKTNYKYSYPNYNVGNEELGQSKNPNSMTWPFGSTSDQ